jgi:hypothetical protein
MLIKRIQNTLTFRIRVIKNGGICMENVISMDKYIENTQSDECEWDIIRNIFQKAIKRKGLTKEQVHETSQRLLREVRAEK